MEDLSKTLTTLVFILTNGHAAVNFNQYDEYAYPPNFPFRLDGAPPKDKVSTKRFRSSRPEVFCKKGVLRNFTKFIRKHSDAGVFP